VDILRHAHPQNQRRSFAFMPYDMFALSGNDDASMPSLLFALSFAADQRPFRTATVLR